MLGRSSPAATDYGTGPGRAPDPRGSAGPATRERPVDRGERADYDDHGPPPGRGRRGGRAARPGPQPAESGADAPPRQADPPSRGRRGLTRSRIWLLAGAAGLLVVLSLLVGGALLLGHHGPTHTLVTPARLGPFVRSTALEQQMGARNLQQQVISRSGGQASHVIYAVYENNAAASGGSSQVILFIGGDLSGVSPSGFISSFSTQFKGARSISPGSMGGSAACVKANANVTGQVALCTWADNDTFGVVASPTMSAAQLAAQMRIIRPQVERTAK